MAPHRADQKLSGGSGRQTAANRSYEDLRPELAERSDLSVPDDPLDVRLSQPPPASSLHPIHASQDPPLSKVAKVAIPRLHHRGHSSAQSGKVGSRHRVTHACEPCRARKTKCSGEKPACKYCQDFKVACLYADGKRDRAKKAFGSLAEKVSDYEAVLEELSSRVGEEDANLIKTLLQKDVASGHEDIPTAASASQDFDMISEETGAESEASASVGSTGPLDRIEEDFNRSERARSTGFIGKNSEITWLQKLRRKTRTGSLASPDAETEPGKSSGASSPFLASRVQRTDRDRDVADNARDFSLSDSSYHLDDFSVFISEPVNPYQTPSKETADRSLATYTGSVHPSFPIIGKRTFSSQYRTFMQEPTSHPGERWLAILNLIFALGARYSQLVRMEGRGDARDHLIYFSRARLLSMNGTTIFSHPDLQQVQVLGLTAFYLLATSQINRAWNICGMAIRAAIALGINFRNESPRTPDTSKEIRCRVWWALYSLESQLSMMTGRPSSLPDQACTAPLPIPIEEEEFSTQPALQMLGAEMQKTARAPGLASRSLITPRASTTSSSEPRTSSSRRAQNSHSPSKFLPRNIEWAKNVPPSASLYFLHYVLLTRISQAAMTWLYTPEAVSQTWSYVQSVIVELNQMISGWHSHLPVVFDFTRNQRDQVFLLFRMRLGFFYYSTRIIVNRPCLCRLDRKLPSQSSKSQEINRAAAATCIDAARQMLQLLTDEPNSIDLHRIAPWWCVLHYLMQAAVVLLLELSYRADHMPDEAENIFEEAQKAVGWLHHLGEDNWSARRAWALCNSLLRETALKIGQQVSQVQQHPPGPPRETWRAEPQASTFESNPAANPAVWAPSDAQSGANFGVAAQDTVNMPAVSGYDQFTSFSANCADLRFFPVGGDTELIHDAFENPEWGGGPGF